MRTVYQAVDSLNEAIERRDRRAFDDLLKPDRRKPLKALGRVSCCDHVGYNYYEESYVCTAPEVLIYTQLQ